MQETQKTDKNMQETQKTDKNMQETQKSNTNMQETQKPHKRKSLKFDHDHSFVHDHVFNTVHGAKQWSIPWSACAMYRSKLV